MSTENSPNKLTKNLSENKKLLKRLLPLDQSFDLVTRELSFGDTPVFFLCVNGFCKTEILQQIFSDLQNPLFTRDEEIRDLGAYVSAKLGYAQVSLTDSLDEILKNVLSGPSLLLAEGFDKAVLIDARSYPTRGIEEPDAEKMTRGARDGFVETLLFNANLIRRRVRSPRLTFQMHSVGTVSKSDVAVAYLDDCVNQELLQKVSETLDRLQVTALTMGAKSLEELLVKKRWCNPLPSIQLTERPDVACSYLPEGHILILVDNSPLVLILPCTIFQFTQSPEDYYKSPLVGSYFRLIRLACIPVSLFLLPLFMLITVYFPRLSEQWQLLSTGSMGAGRIIFYVFAVEFLLDLFKYSASLSASRFSGSLSIIGGLLIGDMAVSLNWASQEILFYAAVTLLSSLSLASIEFAEALRVYRLLLLIATALGGLYGFLAGVILMTLSVATTPTFGGMSYFWPLFPFNGKALRKLLLRMPTAKAQPCKAWDRGGVHE